ncbi:MAG: RNA polymerase sigma factor [Oscillospiraceae bacterium]
MEHPQNRAALVAQAYMKKLFGFALRRTASPADAEDLTQEICLKLFKAIAAGTEIYDMDAFVWRAAHNVLANYYRGKSRSGTGICMELLEERACDEPAPDALAERNETIARLRDEIAYLSYLQRQVLILYYFENRKQSEIAGLLGIPAGTVKWHLFEAKKELRKGMDRMKTLTDLKFNPVKFDMIGFSGSEGRESAHLMHGALEQNIAYACYREAKTVSELADLLGVSPVFVASAAERMEEYGFLLKRPGGRYIANFLIEEPDEGLVRAHDNFYARCAELFAEPLFDALKSSPVLKKIETPFSGDDNFLLWTILLWVLAVSDFGMEETVKFEEAATLRKDGAQNIVTGSVENLAVKPLHWDAIRHWNGPCWNEKNSSLILWSIDNQWTTQRTHYRHFDAVSNSLIRYFAGESLSADDCVFLAGQELLRVQDGAQKLMAVRIPDRETERALIDIGNQCKRMVYQEFQAESASYKALILSRTPSHLRKMQECLLQYAGGFADGWLLLYTALTMLEKGKLTPVPEAQRPFLCQLAITR